MQNNIRKSAIEFVHKHDLNQKNLNVTNLRKIIESLDYGIVDYWVNAENEPDTIALLEETHTTQFSQYAKGFTYCSQEEKLVFICADMSADDTVEVLLHELGHIVLGHINAEETVTGTSIKKEYEAFCFSQCVQERCRKSGRIKLIKAGCIAIAAVLLVCTAAVMFRYIAIPKQAVTEDGKTVIRVGGIGMDTFLQPHCYWTEGGKVFHLWPDCQHLSNSSTIYVGSRERSGKDSCCKTCYKKFCERYGDLSE